MLTAVVAAADAANTALSIVPFVAVLFSTEDEVRLLCKLLSCVYVSLVVLVVAQEAMVVSLFLVITIKAQQNGIK